MTRDAFLTLSLTQPALPSDVIVLLCGEDIRPRLHTAWTLYASGAAPLLWLSGGRSEPPKVASATSAMVWLAGSEIPGDRMLVDDGSQNTREQAVNFVAEAKARGWKSALLVASAYHIPRALLTFVKALEGADVRVLPVPCVSPWFGNLEGYEVTRTERLASELRKITRYKEHVATYQEGIDYLRRWEGA